MDTVRAKQFGALIAVASLGLTALANSALAGKMDALLGDWDLNIAKSKFEPKPPMKKYTMKVIDAGTGHLLVKSDWIESDGTPGHVEYSTAFDGKPISILDYPAADTVTDTMLNSTTWKSVWTKDGKIVESELRRFPRMGRHCAIRMKGRTKKERSIRIAWSSSGHSRRGMFRPYST